MPTTSNFGWTTPADTDLVKDGAAAIRTLGNGIDTSLIDLKGGTTGQVLSKASNTDLDYSWVTPNVGDITEVQAGTGISVASGTGPIPVVTNTVATTFDAKGDLVAGTGADTFAKLTVGANDTVLTADSSTATGLKWATPTSGGMTSIASGSLSGSTTTINNFSASYNNLYLVISDVSGDSGGSLRLRINGDTTANFHVSNFQQAEVGQTYQNGQSVSTEIITATGGLNDPDNNNAVYLYIYDYNSSVRKNYQMQAITNSGGNNAACSMAISGSYQGTSAVTSIDVRLTAGSFDGGTYTLYGVK